MATTDKQKKKKRQEPERTEKAARVSNLLTVPEDNVLSLRDSDETEASEEVGSSPSKASEETDAAPAQLGATKYVHAAFLSASIVAAFLAGKMLAAAWNRLAEWPAAVRAVPGLLSLGESERATAGMIGAAVVGIITLWQIYRRRSVRDWADEVAIELSRVTWPTREQVTNGTVVVLVASAVAAVYVALLDRFWAFVTTLVYGA